MLFAAFVWPGTAGGETIRLENDATFTADVLQSDNEGMVIRLPREAVATIDGKPLPPVLQAGVAAPTFTATDLQGTPYTLDAHQGQVTVLHFWVSWCPFCQADQPKIQALADQSQGRSGVRVLSVSLDRERAKAETFVKERHITYPVILAAAQPNGVELTDLYQITGFPVTYVIDAEGIIRHKVSGSVVKAGVDLGALAAQCLPAPSTNTQHVPRRVFKRVAQLDVAPDALAEAQR